MGQNNQCRKKDNAMNGAKRINVVKVNNAING